MASLKTVDAAAYAVVRSFIAAGAAEWDAWDKSGRGMWPQTDPTGKFLAATIFEYVPMLAVQVPAADDNCPTEEDRRTGTCFAGRYDQVFSPVNRQNLIAALDLRTPADVKTQFYSNGAPSDAGELEWWATAIAAGTLILIGSLSFKGAIIVKIVGYLFAAWAAYGFVSIKTPEGKSLAAKYAGGVSDGFESLFSAGSRIVKLGLGVLAGFALYKFITRGS